MFKRFVVFLAIFVVSGFMMSACSKTDKNVMPITKENLTKYSQAVASKQKSYTRDMMIKIASSKEAMMAMVKDAYVAPMQELGYSYDLTIRDAADQISKDEISQDIQMTVLTMVIIPYQMRDDMLKEGIITAETRDALTAIHLGASHN